jgi:2OG-Fe(II) oxygenase superfamily
MIESGAGKNTKSAFSRDGYCIYEQFLTPTACEELLAIIARFRSEHSLPEIYRRVRGRSLRYFVIDGEKIAQFLPEIALLYEQVNEIINEISEEKMVPLENKKVGVNVNITPKGGEYRWHYDRNEVTALLYLNNVNGGEIDFYPNYRIYLKNKSYTLLQKWLDSVLMLGFVRALCGRRVVIQPGQGRLVVIHANRCLHSVRPVYGDTDRTNIVLSFDRMGATFPVEENLDAYIYTHRPISADPNYI